MDDIVFVSWEQIIIIICPIILKALERSFDVLGFDRDEVPLMDFCQAWEDNNRKLWAINSPDEEYRGSTARDYYNIFVKSYKRWADAYYD